MHAHRASAAQLDEMEMDVEARGATTTQTHQNQQKVRPGKEEGKSLSTEQY